MRISKPGESPSLTPVTPDSPTLPSFSASSLGPSSPKMVRYAWSADSLRVAPDKQSPATSLSPNVALASEKPNAGSSETAFNLKDTLVNWLRARVETVFPKKPEPLSPWQELVEQYAESPFERELLLLKHQKTEATLTPTWARAFTSNDENRRESALSLFRTFVNYGRLDSTEKLSPHTQLKMLHFMPHLDEGKPALATLYASVLAASTKHAQPFLEPLARDFSQFAMPEQLRLLQTLFNVNVSGLADAEKAAWKQAMRSMVTTFYTQQGALNEVLVQQLMAKQEKIRLGFLRFQPIEEAYQQAIEETDKRYRTRLRQLKRQRQLLLSQADEERQRRIGQIYEDLETPLMSVLGQSDFDLEALFGSLEAEEPEAIHA